MDHERRNVAVAAPIWPNIIAVDRFARPYAHKRRAIHPLIIVPVPICYLGLGYELQPLIEEVGPT